MLMYTNIHQKRYNPLLIIHIYLEVKSGLYLFFIR